MDKKPSNSYQDPDQRLKGLMITGLTMIGLLLEETLRLFVTRHPSAKPFPSSKALVRIIGMLVLTLFFFASMNQGVPLVANLTFAAILAGVGEVSLRRQPDARFSVAFFSVLFVGALGNQVIDKLGAPQAFQAIVSAWTLVTILRLVLARGRF
jgi:lipoprotein signal peptidase